MSNYVQLTTKSSIFQVLQQAQEEKTAPRDLTNSEIDQLKVQGNLWDARKPPRAGVGFSAERVHSSRFLGDVVLSGTVYASTLDHVVVGEGSEVLHCPLVRNTRIGRQVLLRGAWCNCSEPTSFGVGTVIRGGLETPGREICIWDAMTLDDAIRSVGNPTENHAVATLADRVRSSWSWILDGAEIDGAAHLDRVFLGNQCRIHGAAQIVDSALVSSPNEPVVVGPGTHLLSSILQWGSHVESGAHVERSILLEHSGAERQALVTESLLGPNTTIGEGEVTASLVGPFVGMHHHSLLIAAWWPEGRGNLGYGANIGSNHTGRAPDQEFRVGEGLFFGLTSAVKYPADFSRAPYTLFSTGVITLPQKYEFPFSLILDDALVGYSGLTRARPGWMLQENLYGLFRNETKFLQRNRARRHRWDLRIFRPEIVDNLWKARLFLENIQGKAVYTSADCAALGKNYLTEPDRLTAIETYRFFGRYAILRLVAQAQLDAETLDLSWLEPYRAALGIPRDAKAVLELFREAEIRVLALTEASRQKDFLRGNRIIDNYGAVHGEVRDDSLILQKQKDLVDLSAKIVKFGV